MHKNNIPAIISALEREYPEAVCSLRYEKDYELLFSTRLAAQCTDERVNMITPHLFTRFSSLEEFAQADITELEQIIHSCGFFRIKARDLIDCARMLLEEFGGRVPDNMDDLLKLPGVGRKTANIILGDIYGKPSVVTDTHCIRISNRLGMVDSKNPYKVEMRLAEIIPSEKQTAFCHMLVFHGRAVCTARSPKCHICTLNDYCAKRL